MVRFLRMAVQEDPSDTARARRGPDALWIADIAPDARPVID